MTPDLPADRRAGDRRSDGVTAKILHAVFAMRRGFGSGAAKNLLLRTGHDDDFIAQVLTIPEERRGQRRRTDAAAAPTGQAALAVDDGPVTLGASAMAVLHRLRFEADSGMHRMTLADCPAELSSFALIRQEQDGTPTITAKGRQALKHFACVRALDSLASGGALVPISDEIRGWLEANLFLQRCGSGYAVTELGRNWLAFNGSLAASH